ncbi:T9SS type A sorting domain-containing protein [bacterium]|nr:T9SS type A sorting domain-containing protein [bacterium]
MNRSPTIRFEILAIAIILGATAVLAAVQPPDFTRTVMGAGGNVQTREPITLKSTAGQSVVGSTFSDRGDLQIRSGFWQPEDGLSGAPGEEIPQKPVLFGNAPNPFNPMTEIRFAVGREPSHACIRIYDLQGRLVRTLLDEVVQPGIRTVTWRGRTDGGGEAASGVYFYRLEVAGEVFNRKMLLVK